MGYRYIVIGAGMQGVASAYDLAKFGDADTVMLVDNKPEVAKRGAERINSLLGIRNVEAIKADVENREAIIRLLSDSDALLSAVPYKYNLGLTKIAIETKTHMVDMGGHTGVVQEQIRLNQAARAREMTVVPDCGMGPGMNITLALYAMSMLEEPLEIRIYDGGFPQDPKPPFNYSLFFHINGLINEYDGSAYYLRNGKIVEIPALSECIEINIPPIGRLEAFVTSGGLSTMPWTFEDKLKVLENKTLRYPGHCEIFRAYQKLGLFSEESIEVGNQMVIPRELLFKLLEPRLSDCDAQDICIIHIRAKGKRDGKMAEVIIHLVDRYDKETKFRAMEKLTGWHAAIVLELATKGEITRGVIPVERALSGERFAELMPKRGWMIEKSIES